jgi:hypothetical protein
MTDRLKVLESYTVAELVGELKRRMAELDEAKALLGGPRTPKDGAKNPAMSEAKAKYWAGWHEYRALHPDATVGEWRKAQKRTKK